MAMKKTWPTLAIFTFLMILSIPFRSLAQEQEKPVPRKVSAFSVITIIKVDELKVKEDTDKVKEVLRAFGYKVHSFKINFEKKEVLIRLREFVSNDDLITAFKTGGYTARYDKKAKVEAADAAYRKKK